MLRVQFSRVLVVEDNVPLRQSLVSALGDCTEDIRSCDTLAETKRILLDWNPQLLLLDFKLPDGNALALLKEISRYSCFPTTVAISAFAEPENAFQLAQLWVRGFLQKPFDLYTFEQSIEMAVGNASTVAPHIRNAVGKVGLKEMERCVRQTMLNEALNRTHGSRRGAAHLLNVSRQFVQHALNKLAYK